MHWPLEIIDTPSSLLAAQHLAITILEKTKDGWELFGSPLIDSGDFSKLIIRFLFNLAICTGIVRFIYYPIAKRKDYLFTYLLISTTVFLLCHLLDNVKLELGFALGLFAIFGIIRYRTDAIPIKEMTYLFIVIGLSVINALANKKISHAELVFTNLSVMALTYGLEKLWLLRHESRQVVTYEKIELIVPKRHHELHADLEQRTGLRISRFSIGKINFLTDTAQVEIFYYEDDQSDQVRS